MSDQFLVLPDDSMIPLLDALAAAPADSQEMSVTYNHGGQVKTVTVATEGQPPAALQTILNRLSALQAELQKK